MDKEQSERDEALRHLTNRWGRIATVFARSGDHYSANVRSAIDAAMQPAQGEKK